MASGSKAATGPLARLNELPMKTQDAVEAIEHLIDHCRERKVASFKGDLLAPDGTTIANLEFSFERDRDKKPGRELE